MIQCGVRLPQDLKQKLEKLAKDDMRSFNSLLNKVLNDYCEKVEARQKAEKLK